MVTENSSLYEIIEVYKYETKGFRLEGSIGLKHLNNLCYDIDPEHYYCSDEFNYGSPLEKFLIDNSGAQEAIINWIAEQDLEDWKEMLLSLIPEDEEEE